MPPSHRLAPPAACPCRHAGILQLGVGGPWYCVLPDSEWPEEEEKRAEIRADFQEPHGDRRWVAAPWEHPVGSEVTPPSCVG
jgi:hypothetical protein